MGVVQPMFRITRNGKKLPAWLYKMITKVTFKETGGDGASQSLEIQFSDPELQVMEAKLFVEKKTKLIVEMGYVDDKDFGKVFNGRVEEVQNDYPKSGMVTLKIVAHDVVYRMGEGEKTKKWKGKTYSDIVKDIFKKYGVTCKVTSTAKLKPRKKGKKLTVIVQSNMSDLDFLQAIAKKCKYKLKIDSLKNKAWFVKDKSKIKSTTTTLAVDYKEGNEKLKAFRPKFNDYKKAMKVTANNINIDSGKAVGNSKKKKKKKKKKSAAKKSLRLMAVAQSNNTYYDVPGTDYGKRTYTTMSGDCLWMVAEMFYGDGNKWEKIYNANRNIISNPNLLYGGIVLIIPE